uniref:Evolutionarily conserved signaling intermediate in Toll pathway, mitochondrial n=1 Tax=Palaemon carinicauda TaxID=392227 RepID=A0A7T5V8Z8_PALCI|nr:ECSIT [Palaemon carinicauda]
MAALPYMLAGRMSLRTLLTGAKNASDSLRILSSATKISYPIRSIASSSALKASSNKRDPDTRLSIQGYFNSSDRNKETFKAACEVYKIRERNLRGHVEFIYSALKYMEEFGVHKDLEVYKDLLDLMPKGKMIPQNMFQAEFMHYPKQQQCAIDVLEQMEINGVMPDTEMEMMLKNIFGKHGHPVKKFGRMMYWMPKFKNASPWSLLDVVPNDAFELAKLAVARMCSVDPTSKLTVYQTKDVEDAIDDTWIVSGMSPIQEELVAEHPVDEPIKIEGPFRIFLRERCVGYFILRAESKPPPPPVKREEIDDVTNIKHWFTGIMEEEETESALIKKRSVHEQDDGTIMAICATGTSSRDSLLSWIRHLQVTNPKLSEIPVLFTQTSPIGEVMTVEEPAGEVKVNT